MLFALLCSVGISNGGNRPREIPRLSEEASTSTSGGKKQPVVPVEWSPRAHVGD